MLLPNYLGCEECRGTGHLGRFGLFAMLVLAVSDPLREAVTGHADLMQLQQQAQADGMENLRQVGAQQVLAGLTNIAEVVRVTPAPLPTEPASNGNAPSMPRL